MGGGNQNEETKIIKYCGKFQKAFKRSQIIKNFEETFIERSILINQKH